MDIQEKVVLFFNKWGIYNKKLKDKTIINNVDEDFMDLEWLFESFFNDFDIKNNCNLDVNKYFYQISIFNKILMKIGIKIKINPKPPITIEHMIEVAKRKEWFDPE